MIMIMMMLVMPNSYYNSDDYNGNVMDTSEGEGDRSNMCGTGW